MEGVTDLPEGVWHLSLTLRTRDGRRFRARRVLGRGAAQSGLTHETVFVGYVATNAATRLLAKSKEPVAAETVSG